WAAGKLGALYAVRWGAQGLGLNMGVLSVGLGA
ncbi:MAG: hypothetical protein ACI9KS_002965, partial [Sulfitobacter sp.]